MKSNTKKVENADKSVIIKGKERILKMKKAKKFVTILALSAGLLGVANNQSSAVQAASSFKIKLNKDAFVYTAKGSRLNRFWKKSSVLRATGTKVIKGKKYYRLEGSKAGYILANTAKKQATKTNITKDANKVDNSVSPEFRKQVQTEFVKLINNWRKAKDLKANSELTKFATLRAQDQVVSLKNTGNLDNHAGFNNYNAPASAECIGKEPKTSAKKLAQNMFNKLVLNDADSQWRHRDILKSAKYSQIGVGIAATGDYYTYAADLK